VSLPPLRSTQVILDKNPSLMTSLDFNYPFTGPISKYMVSLGARVQHMKFGGDIIQFITPFLKSNAIRRGG